ncbi:helix-turn-helix transcriptional regulator [uncultured Parasutterella sp.]|uniref:helix-turn-helix transcriptional regulator n=1 Tax=uncultured Parasutterella sp. TaxID=1263098 RepID=UPI00342A189B
MTNRERQVIDLVSMGLMNCQVASRLNLSERTVETHRANAYRKLGISNFAQLRKVLLLAGLV